MTTRMPALVARSDELHELQSCLAALVRGAGSLAIIEGEPGIGKSRLLAAVLEKSERLGAEVLLGRADELERERPFAAIADALRVDHRFAQLVSTEADAEPGADRSFLILQEIQDLLERRCSGSPVVLAVEDVHWADPSTIRALRSLARRVEQYPLALLITLRPIPRVPELALAVAHFRELGAKHVFLPPLSPEASAQLASLVVDAEIGPTLMTQLGAAGGNPLYICELLNALRDEGALTTSGGVVETTRIGPPPSLQLTIVHRLSFLPERTIELLKLASILGSTFSLRDLSVIARVPILELAGPLTEAVRAGVLDQKFDRLVFSHDLVRQAVYEDFPLPVRKDLHYNAGRELANAGAPTAQVAEQMATGADEGDLEAVAWLRRAAKEAAPSSTLVAVRLLERALALVPKNDPERASLLNDLAVHLLTIGRLGDAHAAIEAGLASTDDPRVRRALQRSLGTAAFMLGDRARARNILEENATGIDVPPDEGAVGTALASLAAFFSGDRDGAERLAHRAVEAGTSTAENYAASKALMVLGLIRRSRGMFGEAVRLSAEANRLFPGPHLALSTLHLHPAYPLGAAYLETDDIDAAESALRRAISASERISRLDVPRCHNLLALKEFLVGRWDDAIAEAEVALAVVEEMEYTPYAGVFIPQGLIAAIAVHRGDLRAAASALQVAEDELARRGPQPGIDTFLWAKGLLADAVGEDPLPALQAAWRSYASGYQFAHRWVAPELVRHSLDRDRATAAAVVAELEEIADRESVPSARGVAARCRGLLDDDCDALLRGVDLYRTSPRILDTALAAEDAAAALGSRGRRDQATALLREAVDVYEHVGAARLAARAEAGLRQLGVTRGRRGPRGRPTSGWASLTPTELAVVKLVARGYTNRTIASHLYISIRTVETHVAHVFTKLGTRSRSELAAAVASRGNECRHRLEQSD